MKISASCAGGYTGMVRRIELDTACQPDGGAIEALIARLDFFAAAPACPVGADLLLWEITVEDGPRRHTVRLADDGSVHDGAWPALLAQLRAAG